jgi:DUF1009 family protein
MRFDVPVVGVPTIENMIRAGATALVLDAGVTLCIDAPRVAELADSKSIAVICLPPLWKHENGSLS